MANNIKIVGEILSTQQVSRYTQEDLNLLTPFNLIEDFGLSNDYIEYYVYDAGGNLLNLNYNYRSFKLPPSSYIDPSSGSLPIIEIDPVNDLKNLNYSSGEFTVQYNFFNNKVSSPLAELFLKEISADRTELRVGSTVLTNEQIESGSLSLINESTSPNYFVDYLANFGDNIQVTVVNVALNKVESGYEILLKLYEPLSTNIQEKSTLWIVREKINPYVFDINLDKLILPPPIPQLGGPNFNIEIPNQNNVSTPYQSFNSLISSVQNVSTSSYQQLLNLMISQSVDINVDYSDFNNFTFFSSAEKRIKNFYNKVKKIEDYNRDIIQYTISSSLYPNMITDLNLATASINSIVAGFDGFEYYMYFESGSTLTSSLEYSITPYPKTGSLLPYPLLSTSSAKAVEWYNWATSSAFDYDGNNQNKLTFTVPSFIKDDGDNESYLNFLDMVGHYFDNIWIYLKAITNVNLANNNLEKGVSKDLVYYVLESLGTKLYNQYGDVDNVDFLIGNSGSANWDNNFTYTGSYLNAIPRKDLLAESYKRIYHNLVLLSKTKGTTYGLQTLISTFGITSSILPVKEYGGYLKSNTLNEFNNDKVRVVTGSIVGRSTDVNTTASVLSPYIRLQSQPTNPTDFRTNDLQYVDISFSPQDKIDMFVSASIVATNPTWNLDDYIGDPRYQYSSSYETLETQRQLYLTPLSSSQLPYTASIASGSLAATDYNSFIRLIQFFDNSLFKMLQDYVPARTSLSTGVTISSPILERNKWVYSNPNKTSKMDVPSGSIAGPTIGTEYTDIYSGLAGSKAGYYTGVITGSIINTYNYFVTGTFNPYLLPSASLTAGDIYAFKHTDFDVMLNNISSSLISRNRQLVEPIFGTQGFILSPIELQDSYETLRTHQLSRYEGIKLSSALYNTYTQGDNSYGKTAVIDVNVLKLGLFTEVVASRFLPNRNNAVLKYLVDKEGNFTELNLRNSHWQEVQNTFIAGDTGSISQFNNQLYSNQKSTDGEKTVYDSGYTYAPILYFGSTASDASIAFQNIGTQNAYTANARNSLITNGFISGSVNNSYSFSGSFVPRVFDDVVEGGTYFKAGNATSFASYSIQETGNHAINISLPFTYEVPTIPTNEATWSLQVYKSVGGVETLLVEDKQFFVAGDPPSSTLTFDYFSGQFSFYLSNAINSTDVTISIAQVYGFQDGFSCNNYTSVDQDYLSSPVIITAGTNQASGTGGNPLSCLPPYNIAIIRRSNSILVNGQYVNNGSVITIGGTQVTISIDSNCEGYAC
jgi:hypothetical protein